VIQVSLDQNLHNGWSMDYEALPPVDLFIPADTDATVAALLAAIGPNAKPKRPHAARPHPLKPKPAPDGEMAAADMANVLRHAVGDRTVCLTHVSLSWHGEFWPFRHPLDFVGSDGGGGVGGGPGISVGAALALKGTGRMPVAVCGDGDFMMGCTAVWTAVHYRIPMLFVVANNRSFYNDEVHQERVAVARNRPVDNKWIGQRIGDPDIDIATVARGQGAKGFGPCWNAGELEKALQEAIAVVEGGGVAVVDARILGGYSPATAAAIARGKADRGT
jgi:thiamine pyrophosphate-dependent acetolactate synthase large subunit-like protein